jgi:hypothetical protein
MPCQLASGLFAVALCPIDCLSGGKLLGIVMCIHVDLFQRMSKRENASQTPQARKKRSRSKRGLNCWQISATASAATRRASASVILRIAAAKALKCLRVIVVALDVKSRCQLKRQVTCRRFLAGAPNMALNSPCAKTLGHSRYASPQVLAAASNSPLSDTTQCENVVSEVGYFRRLVWSGVRQCMVIPLLPMIRDGNGTLH